MADDPAPLLHVDWQRWLQLLANKVDAPVFINMEQIVAGVLGVAQGGTGISSYTIGDLLYASAATTLSKLADVSAGSYLRSGGVGVAPLWSTLKVPNAAATGDLLYGSASNVLSRRAIGATGDVLTVAGGLPVWAATSGLGTGDLTRVNDTNVTVTLGGTPVESLFKDVSLTLGWTGLLGLARGGTNADLSATGGAGRVLKQVSVGAAVTVATLTAAEIASGAALTRVDDTNVTLTLGGSPTTALLAATSLTLGWTGTLSVARGGIGVGTLASNGVLYGNGTGAVLALAVNAGAKLFLTQTTSAAPAWAAIVAGDVPTLNQNTTGSAAKWTTARLLAGNSVDGSANVAFANKVIVQGTVDAGLSAAQFLGALATGLVKNTTSTGVLSIGAVATDYVAPSAYASANGLTMATARLLGRTTAASGAAEEISIAGTLTLSGGVLTGTGGSGTVTGSGTTGVIPKWTSSTALGNSVLSEASSNLVLATASTFIFDDVSGATAQGVLSHEASSPFRITRYLSKGPTGGWQGAHYFSLSYNAGSTFDALTLKANTDGTTAQAVLTGKLSIGITSANYEIVISRASGAPGIQLLDASSGGTGTANGLTMALSTGDFYFNNREAKSIFLATTNAVRWGINAAGDWTFGASAHIADSSGTPTIASGFGTGPSIAGTDYAFTITTGTAPIGGTVNFGHTFSNAPICSVVTSNAGVLFSVAAVSTTQISIGLSAAVIAGDKVYVLCRGY